MDNPIPQNVTRPLDYDPFGMITFGRSWEAGSGYRYAFNGMEGVDEIVGNDNALDFGARVYDSRLGRWFSVDPLSKKYTAYSPYNFALCSPLVFLDPDGMDVVYYNNKGVEVNRIVSAERFEVYVDLNNDGNYFNAPMPNIIIGYEDPIYQKYDYIIAAHTFIFNNGGMEATTTENGLHLDGVLPCKLSPTLVKAIILKETIMGTLEGKYGQNGDSDIMQANVETNNKGTIESDWSPYKTNLGLTEGGSATPEQSIYARIRILYMKGLVITKAKYSPVDKETETNYIIEESTVEWRGDDLNSWWTAVSRYNTTIKNYTTTIYKNWNNSVFSKDSKYYIPEEKKEKSN